MANARAALWRAAWIIARVSAGSASADAHQTGSRGEAQPACTHQRSASSDARHRR